MRVICDRESAENGPCYTGCYTDQSRYHRRISLLHEQSVSWARIGEAVGHGDIATTARHYTHVLSDGTEVDYSELIGTS